MKRKASLNFGLETNKTNIKPTLIKPKTAFSLNVCYAFGLSHKLLNNDKRRN